MPKATYGYKKTLGSVEMSKSAGKRQTEPATPRALEGPDFDSISLIRGLGSSNRSNIQTQDRPPICGVPTLRAHGVHNAESSSKPSTPRRPSRINDGSLSIAHGSEDAASAARKAGKATFAGDRTRPADLVIRPIRTFANGSTSASFSNL